MNATPATITVVESAWGPVVCYTGPRYTAEQFKALIDDEVATLAAKGRKQIEAEAADLKERIAFQRGSRTSYEGGGTVASLEGQLERLRRAWRLAA